MVHDEYAQFLSWYQRSELDYETIYISLYISYNTWYSTLLHTTNNREAILVLKKRYVIWEEYESGLALNGLHAYIAQLVEYTQREPLEGFVRYWDGEVRSVYDWPSLIEFWYFIRCRLVHGAYVEKAYLVLAYETLKLFMDEIVDRIKRHKAIGEPIWYVDMVRSIPI